VQGLLAAEEPHDDALTKDLGEQMDKKEEVGKKKLSYRELMNIPKDALCPRATRRP
jgi:hypothetical protein